MLNIWTKTWFDWILLQFRLQRILWRCARYLHMSKHVSALQFFCNFLYCHLLECWWWSPPSTYCVHTPHLIKTFDDCDESAWEDELPEYDEWSAHSNSLSSDLSLSDLVLTEVCHSTLSRSAVSCDQHLACLVHHNHLRSQTMERHCSGDHSWDITRTEFLQHIDQLMQACFTNIFSILLTVITE